jgi:hypothetical protein
MIATVGVDDLAVAVVKQKIPRQLLRRGFTTKATVATPLIFGQKTDRHGASCVRGRRLQKLQVLRRNPDRRFSQK